MVYNNLFNEKKMEEFLKAYDKELVVNSPDEDPICDWIQMLNDGELTTEQNNYLSFFSIILEDLLGYKLKDIEYEKDIGQKGRPVEFTFKKDDKDYVVVELKGTKTEDLNRRYNRKQSAVEQATNYASVKEETKWAFVSNYNEFRLFNPNYNEKYISFKFKSLRDQEVLKKFLLIFSKFSLIEKGIPQTLLEETKIIERDLEDEFYQLFNETRLMLIKELEHSSEEIDKLEAIRLAQLILNRYIFTCFAEDLLLIPPQTTTKTILTPIENQNLSKFTMWNRINELFTFIDEGNEFKKIGAFNGGLFKEDLGHLKIRDFIKDLDFYSDCYRNWKFEEKYEEMKNSLGVYKDILNPIYKNLLVISSFKFDSELDVNILGHIFENSIGDIEQLKDQTKKRRKEEGVFYTPPQITDYICKNTIIPYLSKSKTPTTIHELIKEYEEEDNLEELDLKLKNIKILDPACGSGAFLNKAVDVLFEIHKALHDSKYANDESLNRYFDSLDQRRQIISNNIYGVDLNEESVEITKLSLFLKLATTTEMKKGFKLPNLDKNIKCGNSIIDSEEYDKKAFNWNEEFLDIFKNGGFDVVIGNPPYVRQEMIKEIKPYLQEHYVTYSGVADLYVYFFERGLNILKENGILSFICSNKYIKTQYGLNLRKLLLSINILKYNDYTGSNIFESATVDTSTIILQKKYNPNNNILVNDDFYLPQRKLDENSFTFERLEIINLREKIKSQAKLIKDLDIEINSGLKTGFNEVFIINNNIRNELITQDPKNERFIEPILRGRDITKWKIWKNDLYLLHIPDGTNIENEYPSLFNYFLKFKEPLQKRGDKGKYWYNLRPCAYDEKFKEEKIIYSTISTEPCFVYDNNGYYLNNSAYMLHSETINLKYLNSLLTSNLLFWYFKYIGTDYGGKAHPYRKIYIEQLPILITEDKDTEMELSNLSEKIIEDNKNFLNEINSFHKWLNRTFNIEKLSNKLEKYYELDFDEFIKEMKKKKVNVKQRKTQDLLEKEFNESLETLKPLKDQIQQTEEEINRLVYELYDLTEEEIRIIENS